MQHAYVVELDGFLLKHECTYHTTEDMGAGKKRRIYPRFHKAASLMQLDLVVDTDLETGVDCARLVLRNLGEEPVRLRRADVGLVFEDPMEIDYFQSDWGSEFTPCHKKVQGEFSFGIMSGRSCKGYTPFVGCKSGQRYTSMTLAWSGNWTCTASPMESGTGCVIGLTDGEFYTDIPGGGSFETPEVYISSADSQEKAALAMRRYYRQYLSTVTDSYALPLALEYNTWWPYEDSLIDEQVYQENAAIAKKLGCRYAMLDAGWFGPSVEGSSWYEKRGDWNLVNEERFPSGMKALCDRAKALEILPGIWCEIEAVGKEARLNETHEKLLAKRNGKSLGYVCLGSKEGLEFVWQVVDRILGEYGAKWIKLDFNLDPGFGCDREDHDHGKGDGLLAHYRNYYRFLDEVHAKYPDVIIENCASGGLRNDIGMLSHTQCGFLSDPDHTEHHLQLLWGALSYLHQSALLHFSWSEVMGDHNMGIRQPMQENTPRHEVDYMLRAVMIGQPGISQKLPELPQWILDRIAEHARFYESISTDFVLNGDAYRLTGQPMSCGRGERFPAFEMVSKDGRAVIFAFRLIGGPKQKRLKLQGLDAERTYTVSYQDAGASFEATGAQLMQEGVLIEGLPENASEVLMIC